MLKEEMALITPAASLVNLPNTPLFLEEREERVGGAEAGQERRRIIRWAKSVRSRACSFSRATTPPSAGQTSRRGPMPF